MSSSADTIPGIKDGQQTRGIALTPMRSMMRKQMSKYDVDGSGTLDEEETARALEDLVAKEVKARHQRWVMIVAVVVSLVVILANLGLSFAVVTLTKDSAVKDDVLMSKATGDVVQTASADMEVAQDGTLLSRGDHLTPLRVSSTDTRVEGTRLVGMKGDTLATKSAPLETSALTATTPSEALQNLRKIQVVSADTGASVSLEVNGWARVPGPAAADNSTAYTGTVKLITPQGLITIDADGDMTFDDVIGSLFADLGFATDSTGRRLLSSSSSSIGLYDGWSGAPSCSVFNLGYTFKPQNGGKWSKKRSSISR